MNLFHLECFLTLSQTLNFRQAAQELYITQPTLSRNIVSLEEEVGTQLIFRNTKTVELTAAGLRFAKHCKALMQQYGYAVEDARHAKEGLSGLIKLGIQRDTFEPFTVDLVNNFRREHPDIELSIQPLSVKELQQGISKGSLDLIIGAYESNLAHPGRLLINERQECAVLSPDHPLSREKTLRMEQLVHERFVAMSPTSSSSGNYLLLKYANHAGFSPNIVAMANSVPSMVMLAACGVGIAILYQDLACYTYDRLRFIPLEGLETFKRYLIWDENSTNPALPAFLSCVRAAFPHITG